MGITPTTPVEGSFRRCENKPRACSSTTMPGKAYDKVHPYLVIPRPTNAAAFTDEEDDAADPPA
ncbi:MAG TPA: hypothetical protein VEI57_00255 [Nitrospirota bacterium]|nr:hypothetical protein [Nitrospirota bacterium]